MIDHRLEAAVAELEEVTRALRPPEGVPSRLGGIGVAFAVAVTVIVTIGAVRLAVPPADDPAGVPAVSAPDQTPSTAPPATAVDPTRIRPVPLNDAQWTVADPLGVQRTGIAGLGFELAEYANGARFEVLELAPVESLGSLPSEAEALLPQTGEPIEVRVIGRLVGDTVIKVRRGDAVSVCLVPLGTCHVWTGYGETWTLADRGPDQFEPIPWLAPPGTAVVRFSDHANTFWMVPVEDVVAFPWFFTDSSARLTAFSGNGDEIGEFAHDAIDGPTSSLALPSGTSVELLRELNRRGLGLVSIGEEVPAKHPVAPFGQVAVKTLGLSDGTTALAAFVGDSGRGFVVVWLDTANPLGTLSVEGMGQSAGPVVATDLALIVVNGADVGTAIDWWNAFVEAREEAG